MQTNRVVAFGLASATVVVAIAGVATAVSASAPHARTAAWQAPVYVHRIAAGKTDVTVRVPAHRQTGRLMPIKVPAGHYVVTLTGEFSAGSEAAADLYCGLTFAGKNTTTNGLGLGVFVSSNGEYQSANEQDVVTLKTTTKINAYCGTHQGNTTSTAGIYTANLTAIAVGAIRH